MSIIIYGWIKGSYQLAQFTVRPGKLKEIIPLLKTLQSVANEKEEGTLSYTVTHDPEDDRKITIWEEYASEDAFNAHLAGEPFVAFKAASGELLSSEIGITRLIKLQ